MLQYLAYPSLLFSSLALASTVAKFDPPDLSFEYQLHRQYVLAHDSVPRSEVGNLENYSLQRGETLWGLSQMLYGDGSYWPKVWAQNQAITNPHLIRQGHTLQFIMGSEDDTPAFRFSEGDDSGLELAAATTTTSSAVQIPPPETAPRPVIKIPTSFPAWQEVYHRRPNDFHLDDSKMVFERKMPPDRFPLSAYAQDSKLEPVGSFLETEKESGLPVENQFVYVKLKRGKGLPGQSYLIVKDHGKIRKLNSQVEGDIEAHFIQVYGQVDIRDKVESSFTKHTDLEEYEVFRALLVKAMNLSLSNFDLIPGHVEVVSMDKQGPEGAGDAQVIGSMKHPSSALYGPGDIVFLNKGSEQGFQPGQIMDLAIDRSIRDERTPVNFSGYSSGLLKVVKVSGSSATAILLSSIDSIQQGDRAQAHARLGGGANPPPSKPGDDLEQELTPAPEGDVPSESGDDLNLSE